MDFLSWVLLVVIVLMLLAWPKKDKPKDVESVAPPQPQQPPPPATTTKSHAAPTAEQIRAFQEGSRSGQKSWRESAKTKQRPAPKKTLEKVRSQVVSFDYVDANGDFTTRKVRVDTVGEWNFEGYCYKRRERRTFRYDGVVGHITLQETGEVVAPSDLKTTLINGS